MPDEYETRATDDFIKQYEKLDKSVRKRADKAIDKIISSPERLPLLSNELSSCRKVYFNNKKHRIVYTICKNVIWLIVVGKRSKIYNRASTVKIQKWITVIKSSDRE